MKKLVIAALIITSVALLFPLRMMILSFDTHFVTEFMSGWNHRIREMIQSEQISYSQGMLLIFNEDIVVSVIRRAVYVLTVWLLSIIILMIGSLNVNRTVWINGLLIMALLLSLPLVIVPLLLVIAVILFNYKKGFS
ncbi:hypothetical protein ERX37_04320 [Macrococcus hajekii]|uniref:Uncharacterized protein n=1 Tax=Macrococcus hajekii TaxID=198482 RepID=A0A4R6BNA1_9STAP|nr:hypothetical protein [Macrococcus hajekii]TDM03316.1 hypothetical protein ERX37_04320 [Macrococcus hajekii]GGA97840.1 hypothetical protein GCM10007190_02310 [Macrococcus hajekii]